MRILITGEMGFIGSHLADRLLMDGHEVTGIDIVPGAKIKDYPAKGASCSCRVGNNYTYVRDTILDEILMEKLIKECDIVYHLAAVVGVKQVLENPLGVHRTNVLGTGIVFKLANKYGKKVIFTSSSEVYGKGHNRPMREDDDRTIGSTQAMRWIYGYTKAIDEFLAIAYWHKHKLPVVIARLFNVCGPRQRGRYGMVMPRFTRWAELEEPIQVYGDGKQVRSFCYIGDVVDALILLANTEEAVGEVFNVGNPFPVRISWLANRVRKVIGGYSKIMYVPYEKVYGEGFEDIGYRVPDISKITKLTGWKPKVGIDEIIRSSSWGND